jgi:hypothetical protein
LERFEGCLNSNQRSPLSALRSSPVAWRWADENQPKRPHLAKLIVSRFCSASAGQDVKM